MTTIDDELVRLKTMTESRISHKRQFEELRDKIEEEGIPFFGKNGTKFYNYDGAVYCVGYPFIIQTGGRGLAVGKFRFYGIEPGLVYFDFADVPDLFDFIDTYRKAKK